MSLPEIERIVELLTADLRHRLEERGVRLELTPEARSFVARQGFDPVYGARPLKRFLQRQLESRIGRALLAGEAAPGATVLVSTRGDELAVEIVAVEAPVGAV